MATAGGTRAAEAARRRDRLATASARSERLDAASAAWLAALPCALVTLLAVVALGPPVGGLLGPGDGAFTFLPVSAAAVFHESTEHARYLIALGGPILLALATWWLAARQPRIPPRVVELAVPAAQVATVALLVVCVAAQYEIRYGAVYTRIEGVEIMERYFNPATLVAAFAIAALLVLAVRSESVRTRAGAWLRETTARRWTALGLAALATVVWLLHAVISEDSIAAALSAVRYHLEFTLDETFAVLNGRTPLVDFSAQYSSLWPFASALALSVFGKSVLTFTIAMCALSAVALLAIYGVLRRATRSSVAALLLYVPFLATSLFAIGEASVNRGSFANYFGIFPLRYAGPYLVAWLAARHLDRDGRRVGAWLLFAAAGLALVNNTDFGAAAFGASLAALVWGARDIDRRAVLTLLGCAAAGLATALALVALLTLARTGSLPQLDRVGEYARVYGLGGYAMFPLPSPLGLHVAIYLTYVAAIGVATVRALRGATNVVLTGMLAWSGVFGLGSAAYYVGRSQPEALRTTFSVWALALALLTFVALRHLAAHPARRPSIAALAVLAGFGIAVCSVVQVPLPWQQVERIRTGFVAGVANGESAAYPRPLLPPTDERARRFVVGSAERGAPIAILITTGHRIADAWGVSNVSPYTGVDSIHTVEQVDEVVAALRDAGGDTIVLSASSGDGSIPPTTVDVGLLDALGRHGFALVTPDGPRPYDPERAFGDAVQLPWLDGTVVKLVDTRGG